MDLIGKKENSTIELDNASIDEMKFKINSRNDVDFKVLESYSGQ